jgi:hypothetical protein
LTQFRRGKKKDKPQIQAEKKLSTGGLFFNLADFVFQKKKENLIKFTFKKSKTLICLPSLLPEKKGKKKKDKYANHEDFSRPQNSYKILFSPLPTLFTSSGIRSLIQSEEISNLARAKTIDDLRPIETGLQN